MLQDQESEFHFKTCCGPVSLYCSKMDDFEQRGNKPRAPHESKNLIIIFLL